MNWLNIRSKIWRRSLNVNSTNQIFNSRLVPTRSLFVQQWKYQNNMWNLFKVNNKHYVKSVRSRSYSGPHFPAFGLMWTEYEKIRCISSYSVRMRENADQNNSQYEHFTRSERHQNDFNNVVLLSLLLRLNLFHALLLWFHCWLWTSKCRLGILISIANGA